MRKICVFNVDEIDPRSLEERQQKDNQARITDIAKLEGKLDTENAARKEEIAALEADATVLKNPNDIDIDQIRDCLNALLDLVGAVWQITDQFSDGVTTAALLRGGSAFQAADAEAKAGDFAPRYLAAAADLAHHVRLPLVDESSLRS